MKAKENIKKEDQAIDQIAVGLVGFSALEPEMEKLGLRIALSHNNASKNRVELFLL